MPDEILDPYDHDAFARLQQLLDSVGLSTLRDAVWGYIRDGMLEDSIILELQNTQEWRARFAANERRRQAGLSVLTPAEYLATERAYRQIMAEAGVPQGFYDQVTDFTEFLAKDISPAELQDRVQAATDRVRQNDPRTIAYFRQWYTEGDMIAYALDPKRAAPLVGRAFQAASIGGIAGGSGLDLSQGVAEQLADAGVTDAQAREGFNRLGQDRRRLDLLAQIAGESPLTADDLARGTLLGDADVNTTVSRLRSAERARFQGSSAVTKGSLSKATGL